MSDEYRLEGTSNEPPSYRPGSAPPIIVQAPPPPKRGWLGKTAGRALLAISLIGNVFLYGLYQQYYPNVLSNERFRSGDEYAPDKIAVIKVRGMITSSSVADPKRELELARKDKGVKAVVLDVESPGGVIGGSDELYHAIEEFRKKSDKPVVVMMSELATSGAYYISAPADKIYADRSCLTGSIGVIMSMFDVEKLIAEWGINPETIKSGKMKDAGTFLRKMTPEERAYWQSIVDQMYAQFLDVILKHRTDKVGGEKKLRELADGRVYLAPEAKKLGLIDEIGYMDDALAGAAELAKLKGRYRVVTYARPSPLLPMLSGETKAHGLDFSALAEIGLPRPLLIPPSMVPLASLAR